MLQLVPRQISPRLTLSKEHNCELRDTCKFKTIWLEWPVKAQPLKARGEPRKDLAGSNLLIQIHCAIKTTQVTNAHICCNTQHKRMERQRSATSKLLPYYDYLLAGEYAYWSAPKSLYLLSLIFCSSLRMCHLPPTLWSSLGDLFLPPSLDGNSGLHLFTSEKSINMSGRSLLPGWLPFIHNLVWLNEKTALPFRVRMRLSKLDEGNSEFCSFLYTYTHVCAHTYLCSFFYINIIRF